MTVTAASRSADTSSGFRADPTEKVRRAHPHQRLHVELGCGFGSKNLHFDPISPLNRSGQAAGLRGIQVIQGHGSHHGRAIF
jgi:hypothetical protein